MLIGAEGKKRPCGEILASNQINNEADSTFLSLWGKSFDSWLIVVMAPRDGEGNEQLLTVFL